MSRRTWLHCGAVGAVLQTVTRLASVSQSVAKVSLWAPLLASVTTLPAVPVAARARFEAVAAAFSNPGLGPEMPRESTNWARA